VSPTPLASKQPALCRAVAGFWLTMLATLSACSDVATAPEPALKNANSAPLLVAPGSLSFIVPPARPATLTATVQFVGTITAESDDADCATVSPLSAPATKPPGSSVYVATFTVTPVAAGQCTITVRDKKGRRVAVAVAVVQGGPSGIVFTSDRDGGDADVFRMDADGGNVTALTDNDDYNDSQPSLSPDRNRIAFISVATDETNLFDWGLYTMGADGSSPQRLTNAGLLANNPGFAPDGRRLVYNAQEHSGVGELYTIAVDNTDVRRLTVNETQREQWPVFTPDGKILFTGDDIQTSDDRVLYVINTDGTNPQVVVTDAVEASVSPDGSEIVFASDADGDFDVYVLTRATGAIRQLTNDAASDGQPVFSPDGSRIAFSTRRDGDWEIYVMNAADGSAATNLTNSAASDDFEPDWK
jgi:Tol biopolymer transport system component